MTTSYSALASAGEMVGMGRGPRSRVTPRAGKEWGRRPATPASKACPAAVNPRHFRGPTGETQRGKWGRAPSGSGVVWIARGTWRGGGFGRRRMGAADYGIGGNSGPYHPERVSDS